MTIGKLNKVLSIQPNETYKIPFEVDDEIINIEVEPFISLQEMSDIIDASANAVWTDEGFSYEYKEAVFKYKVIDILTNIPTLKKKDNIDLAKYTEIYDRIELEDIIPNMVGGHYYHNLIIDLRTAIDKKIEYTKQLIIHSNRNDEIVDGVVGIINKINSIIDKYSSELENVDIEQMLPMLQKLSENKLDKDAIKTILDVGNANKGNVVSIQG